MELEKNFPREVPKNQAGLRGRFLWHLLLAFVLWMIVFGYNYTWKGQYLHIHMERRLCFGQCAMYDVDILGSGLVVSNGKLWVKEEGWRVRFISQKEVQDLIDQAEALEYFSLDNFYNWGGEDLPSIKVSVEFGGRELAIYHDPDGRAPHDDIAPPGLGKFEAVIEGVVIDWVGERK